MKTSLTEIEQVENFLNGHMETGDRLVLEARLLTDPSLQSRVQAQQKVYQVIRHYGKEKLRAELELIHQRLFSDPHKITFRERILKIFH